MFNTHFIGSKYLLFLLGVNMYNYPYYNQQPSLDRINNQIAELEKLKSQMQQPVQPSINQTFQLSPNQGGIRYANTIEDVNKEIVFNDTAFFSNDMSVLWVKNASGDVKSYELKEIIEKDEKDVQIEFLMAKISELEKEMNANARTDDSDVDEHPIGRYAVTMPNHITSVINGNIIDTFDPSDKVMRCAWKI